MRPLNSFFEFFEWIDTLSHQQVGSVLDAKWKILITEPISRSQTVTKRFLLTAIFRSLIPIILICYSWEH